MRPWSRVLWCLVAGVIGGGLPPGAGVPTARAAGEQVGAVAPRPCEPLDGAAVAALAARFALDESQRQWLEAAYRRGALRSADDLAGLPGAGSALREALEGAICWDGSGIREGLAAGRSRPGGARQTETRLRIRGPRAAVLLRVRTESGAAAVIRGGGSLRRGGWTLRGGTLRARSGLGLLLATPGMETRGRAPVRAIRGDWAVAQGLDPRTPVGAALTRVGGNGAITAVLASDRFDGAGNDAPPWGLVSGGRRVGSLGVRATVISLRGSIGSSLALTGGAPEAAWAVEWATNAGHRAGGAAWSLARGPGRIRGSLLFRGVGWTAPAGWHLGGPLAAPSVSLRLEGTLRPGRGRFLRLGMLREGDPGRGDRWPQTASEFEVEVGERPVPGLGLTLLWRGSRDAARVGDPPVPGRVMRLDLDHRRRPWRLRLRWEERLDAGASARLTAFRLGWEGQRRLEFRAALVEADAGAPAPWWYRRRAGGLYGWDRLAPGVWIGAWARAPVGGNALEASVDRRGDRWDLAAAWRF